MLADLDADEFFQSGWTQNCVGGMEPDALIGPGRLDVSFAVTLLAYTRLSRHTCRLSINAASNCCLSFFYFLRGRETRKVWKGRFGLKAILRLSEHSHFNTLDVEEEMRAIIDGAVRQKIERTESPIILMFETNLCPMNVYFARFVLTGSGELGNGHHACSACGGRHDCSQSQYRRRSVGLLMFWVRSPREFFEDDLVCGRVTAIGSRSWHCCVVMLDVEESTKADADAHGCPKTHGAIL
jgi:hypothetical protein